MIRLKQTNGRTVIVNPAHITTMEPSAAGGTIVRVVGSDHSFLVIEPDHVVEGKIREARRA